MSINELTNIHGADADERSQSQIETLRFALKQDLAYAIEKGIISASHDIEHKFILRSERDKARLQLDRDLSIRYGVSNRKAKMNWTLRWSGKALALLVGFLVISGVSGAIPFILLSNGEMTIQPIAIFVTEVCSVIALWGLYQAVKAWGDFKDGIDSYLRYKNRLFLLEGMRGKPEHLN